MLLLRRLQQRNKFVTLDLDFPLSISQSFTLLEVAAGNNTAKDLSELFGLEQSTISRNLAILARDKYLKFINDPADARKKIIQLASKGQNFIEKYNKLSEQQIHQYSQAMSKEKLLKFQEMFGAFNDGLDSPKLKGHAGDSKIRREMRRMVFGLKAFSQSFMDSGLNIAEWQLLSELIYKNKPLNQTEISSVTGIAKSSLPAIVARLCRMKLIKQRVRASDTRTRDLQATSQAVKLIAEIESTFCKVINIGLESFNPADQLHFLDLLELFIGENHLGHLFICNNLYCRQTSDPAELKQLRTTLLSQLSQKNKLHLAPSIIFDKDSDIWAICNKDNVILGGIELQYIDNSVMVQNVLVPQNLDFVAVLKFVAQKIVLDKKMCPVSTETYFYESSLTKT